MALPLSLVITVYNREQTLGATIESILKQTRQDFELLIWDDGSTDRSLAVARHYDQKDRRIKVIDAPHLGRGLALYKAILATQGDFIGWVDSDDLLAPTALAETTAILERSPQVGMVYTDYRVMDVYGNVQGVGSRCQIPYSRDRLLVDFMTFHFRLIRRSVYDQIGGINPAFDAAGDYDLCLKLSEVTEIHHLPQPLYYYRDHANNISHARQLDQIKLSAQAITAAIQRRGLAEQFELSVQVKPRYLLRRKPIKGPRIFGIGLGRTGTTSLCAALQTLGYTTVHLPQGWDDIERYEAAADTNVAIAYRELDKRYPESKFILTLREQESWLASWAKHDAKLMEHVGGKLPQWTKGMRKAAFGQWEFDAQVWQRVYERHQREVLVYFKDRPKDFLVLNLCAGEGWEKLCPFLEKPIPDKALPHHNKSSDPIDNHNPGLKHFVETP